jgi:hypothetical protein
LPTGAGLRRCLAHQLLVMQINLGNRVFSGGYVWRTLSG